MINNFFFFGVILRLYIYFQNGWLVCVFEFHGKIPIGVWLFEPHTGAISRFIQRKFTGNTELYTFLEKEKKIFFYLFFFFVLYIWRGEKYNLFLMIVDEFFKNSLQRYFTTLEKSN